MFDTKSIDARREPLRFTRDRFRHASAADILDATLDATARTVLRAQSSLARRGLFDALLSATVQIALAALIVACGTAAVGLFWMAIR